MLKFILVVTLATICATTVSATTVSASTARARAALSRSPAKLAVQRIPAAARAATASARKNWQLALPPPITEQEIDDVIRRAKHRQAWKAKREDKHLQRVWRVVESE